MRSARASANRWAVLYARARHRHGSRLVGLWPFHRERTHRLAARARLRNEGWQRHIRRGIEAWPRESIGMCALAAALAAQRATRALPCVAGLDFRWFIQPFLVLSGVRLVDSWVVWLLAWGGRCKPVTEHHAAAVVRCLIRRVGGPVTRRAVVRTQKQMVIGVACLIIFSMIF